MFKRQYHFAIIMAETANVPTTITAKKMAANLRSDFLRSPYLKADCGRASFSPATFSIFLS